MELWTFSALATLWLCAAPPTPSPDHTPTREEAQAIALRARSVANLDGKPSAEMQAELARKMPRPPTDEAAYAAAIEALRARPTAELFAFASYEGRLPEENLGQQVQMGGAFTRMASMMIKEAPTRLLALFRERLAERRPQVGRLGERAAYLAFREADGFLRTLTFVTAGERTLLIASVTDPERVAPKGMSIPTGFPTDLPLPEYAGQPVDLRSEEGDFVQYSRQGVTVESSPDSLVAQLIKRMSEAGWAEDTTRKQTIAQVRTMNFTKGERTCGVTIVPQKASGCLLTLVCLERRSSP